MGRDRFYPIGIGGETYFLYKSEGDPNEKYGLDIKIANLKTIFTACV